MELFVVNRFYGYGSSSKFLIDDNGQSQTESNKTPIQNDEIKTKKKKHNENNSFNEENESISQDNCDNIRKNKKSKHRDNEEIDETETVVEPIDETINKSKKRKSKLENTELNVETNLNKTIEKKKKKKPKHRENNEDNIIKDTTNSEDLNDISLTKKKKRKLISEDVLEDKTLEVNESIESNKIVKSKKKKRKSEIINESTEISNELDNSINNSKKKKKKKLNETDNELKKSSNDICDVKSNNEKKNNKSNKNSIPNNKNVKSIKGNVQNENSNSLLISKELNQSLESDKENANKIKKKRFRQRAGYKNRPSQIQNKEDKKNEDNKLEVDSEQRKEGINDEEGEKRNKKDLGGFQVIGNLDFQKIKEVKRVLPEWLAKPTVISVNMKNLDTKIDDLPELNDYFKTLLKKNRVTHFFPVQSELIPFLIKQHTKKSFLWPRDICVSAPTGSGKTLAFVLPIVQLLQYRVVPKVRALVVLPTQDLASQVYKVFKSYVKGTKLQVVLTVGSTPIHEERKTLVGTNLLGQNISLVDIVITTPGRLVDHITHTPGFDLTALRFLVVDEADRMIDSNDCNWLMHINKYINYQGLNSIPPLMVHTFTSYPDRPQRLLFSATLSHDPEKLHPLGLFQPKLFTSVVIKDSDYDQQQTIEDNSNFKTIADRMIGKFTTPNELSEKIVSCNNEIKPLVLYYLIKKYSMKGILCFVNTTQGTHRLAKLLYHIDNISNKINNKGKENTDRINIAEVYSDLKFEQRNKIMQEFRKGKIQMVVASDNLARGIDVENIDYVINYEAPDNIKKYIHRIGRTARGGRDGTAVTFITTEQKSNFVKMLSNVDKTDIEEWNYAEEDLEKLENIYTKALELLKKDIQKEEHLTLKIAKAQRKGKRIKNKMSKKLLTGQQQKQIFKNKNNKNKKDKINNKKKEGEINEKKSSKGNDNNKLNKEIKKTQNETESKKTDETVKINNKDKSDVNKINKKEKKKIKKSFSKTKIEEAQIKSNEDLKESPINDNKNNKTDKSIKRKDVKIVINKIKGKLVNKKNKDKKVVNNIYPSKSISRNMKIKLKKKMKKKNKIK